MRLPPLPPEQLDDDQRAFHEESRRFIESSFSGFQTQRADGALVGPWSVWIRQPTVGRAIQHLTAAVGALGQLSPRVREIVIVTLGARFNAAYELYAHCAIARQAGLDERQIATLVAGRRPDGLSDQEELAFDCASVLARGGVLPGFLYAAAEDSFGSEGLAQLVYLAGVYALVSIMLNAHDVPAPPPSASG